MCVCMCVGVWVCMCVCVCACVCVYVCVCEPLTLQSHILEALFVFDEGHHHPPSAVREVKL